MTKPRKAEASDIQAMVALSEAKRDAYQEYSPVFWRKAADSADRQRVFFETTIEGSDVIALVAESDAQIQGFVIGRVISAPPVYDPGGPVLMIDDFAVAGDDNWAGVGMELLQATQEEAKARGAALSVVVCGHLDRPKRELLGAAGLSIASEWYVAPL